MEEVADDEACLAALPPELFVAIAKSSTVKSLGRLASSCHQFQAALAVAEEAWAEAWRAATNAAVPPNVAARTALKSITTLNDLHWKPLPAQPEGPDAGHINPGHYAHTGMVIGTTEAPRWREDAFVAVCNGGKRLVLFGGRDADHSIYFNDTWTCDLTTGEWLRVNPANIPSRRCFNSDAGGGRVIRSGEEEWALIFGGLCEPGHRDNQTWLLGPLDEAPSEWAWMPVMPQDFGRGPCARFHHTLTVVPRRAETGPTSYDFVVMIGGHDRTISPIFDLHMFSLRDASFRWLDRPGSSDDESRRVEAQADWYLQERELEPCARGFHSAVHYYSPMMEADCIIVCCGMGPTELTVDGVDDFDQHGPYFALGDAWLFNLNDSEWSMLPGLPDPSLYRSRAALTVARDRLFLAGGCRNAIDLGGGYYNEGPDEDSISPGTAFFDLWVLDMIPGGYEGYDRWVWGSKWVQVHLPTERPTTHINANAHVLHGGAVLLILGGHRSGVSYDNFGDVRGADAWALHEGEAISLNGALHSEHATTRRCTAGQPFYHGPDDAGRGWVADRGAHVLLHGMANAKELNGAIGRFLEGNKDSDPDSRVGVRVGPPHNRDVHARRKNLAPSIPGIERPLIVQPCVDDGGGAIWALTSARGHAMLKSPEGRIRNGIAVSKLVVMPEVEVVDEAVGVE